MKSRIFAKWLSSGMLILFAAMGMAPCQADPAAAVERVGASKRKNSSKKRVFPPWM